jgi:hypothetical protein
MTILYEDLHDIILANAIFWNTAPCRSHVKRRFGGAHPLYLLGRKSVEQETGEH